MKRFWDKTLKKGLDECWIWKAAFNRSGYGQFWFNKKMVLAHRMAYALFFNRMDIINHNNDYHKDNNNFECVLHKCDNKLCCNPNHLFLGNNKDNILDKINKNRQQRMHGSKNGFSKLKEKDILKIRSIYAPKKNGGLNKIAKEYNVSCTTIWQIIKKDTWKHI